MSGGAAQTVLPIAGAVVGGVATGGNPAGVMAGYSLGSAAGGMVGGSSGGSSQAMLGAQPSQVVGANQGGDDSPFAAYGDQANPTGNMPSKVEGMNLPQGTEAPSGTGKAAGLSSGDMAGYATTAMQAISAAQSAQQARDMADAQIANARWRDPTVVRGPDMGNVSTNMGGFPTVGQGFMRY